MYRPRYDHDLWYDPRNENSGPDEEKPGFVGFAHPYDIDAVAGALLISRPRGVLVGIHVGDSKKHDYIRKKVLVELGFAKWCVVCRIGNGKQPSVGVVFIPEAKRTHPFAVTEQCWGCGGEKIVTPQTNQLRR